MLLRAGLAAPPPQQMPYYHAPLAPQPPPRPVVPPKPPALKNLCEFPVPAIEGVGKVTVTLEDYKTLQVSEWLLSLREVFFDRQLPPCQGFYINPGHNHKLVPLI